MIANRQHSPDHSPQKNQIKASTKFYFSCGMKAYIQKVNIKDQL